MERKNARRGQERRRKEDKNGEEENTENTDNYIEEDKNTSTAINKNIFIYYISMKDANF